MVYSQEEKESLFFGIIDRIESKGMSLTKAVEDANADHLTTLIRGTFFDWIEKNEEWANRYARARATLIEKKFESIEADYMEAPKLDAESGRIDHGWVALQKLKIDAKKWELSKLMPQKYGDRLAINADVKTENKTNINYDKLSDAALEEIVNAANNENDSAEN